MYADDLVLLAKNEQDLQRLDDVLGAWCAKWGLLITKEKSKVMQFRRVGQLQSTFNFTVNGEPLEYVNSYKYLG